MSLPVSRTHKVGEESLGEQVEVLDSADGDGEQALAVCDWLRGNGHTHGGQQEDGWQVRQGGQGRQVR